jgi:GR25 family glycosyltransferase involved in LPS biosynthesis
MKNYISKIYIIHYTKLTDRKKHMLSEISKWGLDVAPVYFEERMDQEEMAEFDIYQTINKTRFLQNTNRNIKNGEASLCLKYNMILEDIATKKDDEYVLVLEDDVIFKQDPLEYINSLLAKCVTDNVDFDCIFMGEAALRVGDNRDVFFKKQHPATNGLCTVLYKVSSAKRILNYIKIHKIDHALDWYFNKVFEDLKFDVYWAKAITEHGSVSAVHNSALSGLKSSLRERY